jgi:hypothetical protein
MGTVPTGVEEAARGEIAAKLRPSSPVHSTMGKVRIIIFHFLITKFF